MCDTDDVMAWQYEVANGDTRLGFDDWVEHRREREANLPVSARIVHKHAGTHEDARILTSERADGTVYVGNYPTPTSLPLGERTDAPTSPPASSPYCGAWCAGKPHGSPTSPPASLERADALARAVDEFSGLCVDDCEHDDCANVKAALDAYDPTVRLTNAAQTPPPAAPTR